MTLLYSNPHRKFTAKYLAEFINAYDFGLGNYGVTPMMISAIMRDSGHGSKTFMTKVQKERLHNKDVNRCVMHYWVER